MDFRDKLKEYRNRIGLSQAKFDALLGTSSCVVWEARKRRIGGKVAKKLFTHFLEVNEQEMALGLLACLVDTDPAALHQQLESAAWRWVPEYPSDDREVIIAISSLDWEGKPYTATLEATYRFHRWFDGDGGLMRHDEKVFAWRERLDAPPLHKPAPMLEAGQGGGDE